MSHYPALLLGVAVACILAIFMAGCTQTPGTGTGSPSPSPTTPGTQTLTLSEEDNGKNVTVSQGSEISLVLPENPTTGYSWNLSHSTGLTLISDDFIPPGTQLMGAGGSHEWVFHASGKGDQAVHAEYRRPWVKAGTIAYQDLEGGFYGIVGDDGKKYLPLDLDAQYRQNGMRVVFEYMEAGDVATIQMWGIPVNITFIEETETFDLVVKVT